MDPIDASPAEPTALSPMRYPVFRAVWFASLLSNFGALIQSVGAAWLMISIAQSADMVALVQASIALPVMLLSLVAGALADNRDRRVVMLGTQYFMLAVSIALAACAWAGVITPWLLLLFTFLIGCGSAFNAPAWQASVGDMVPRSGTAGRRRTQQPRLQHRAQRRSRDRRRDRRRGRRGRGVCRRMRRAMSR